MFYLFFIDHCFNILHFVVYFCLGSGAPGKRKKQEKSQAGRAQEGEDGHYAEIFATDRSRPSFPPASRPQVSAEPLKPWFQTPKPLQ